MQNRFALCAFLALGVVFQAQSTVPQLPQHQIGIMPVKMAALFGSMVLCMPLRA